MVSKISLLFLLQISLKEYASNFGKLQIFIQKIKIWRLVLVNLKDLRTTSSKKNYLSDVKDADVIIAIYTSKPNFAQNIHI